MATADNRLMTDATGQGILTALQNLAAVQAVPYVASIPTGQWSGSGNDWYITINASNVTANSILIPNYDKDSSELLNGPVWCVPAAGSFTIHTSAIPAGTVTIMVMFAGTMGEAQYQVLDDVYSTSQTFSKTEINSAIAQSTANLALADGYTGNIDNMLKTGLYYLSGATGTGIGSNGAWGMLIVVTQNGRSVQIHADVWSDYVRFRRYGGSWSTWKDFTLS